MKWILLVFILMSSTPFLRAQDNSQFGANINESSNLVHGKLGGKVFKMAPDALTHFLYPGKWVNGEIIFVDGEVFNDIDLRYHAFDDELIVYNKHNSKPFVVDKFRVKEFIFDDNGVRKKFVRLNLTKDDTLGKYFEMLVEGESSLLAFRYIAERKVDAYIDKSGIKRDTEYWAKNNYYVYSPESGSHKMTPKRKSFYTTFPNHKKEIRKIFRQARLLIKDESSMVNAFQLLQNKNVLK